MITEHTERSKVLLKSCEKKQSGTETHRSLCITTAVIWFFLLALALCTNAAYAPVKANAKHAYATMLYCMGTPRDYEFFVAARVMMQSLFRLKVDADLVVIVSKDVPQDWMGILNNEGVRVVSVDNIQNPYRNQDNFDKRFMFTLNKIYAWSLLDYDRVVMLDADNLFLQKTDELFQCGQFCATFINPCIFHTGLFVLQPSNRTFNDLLHEIEVGRTNEDGADQGFLMAYFDDLLERPLFRPPDNGLKLDGYYRLPLGYQMDASYFYLRLRWNVPCGPNSVITFPSLPRLKPWYWWSWPILPLGLSWHEQRRTTIGYGSQTSLLAIEGLFYIGIILIAIINQCSIVPSEKLPLYKSCISRDYFPKKLSYLYTVTLKMVPMIPNLAMAGCFLLPFLLVPATVHPLMGWATFLLGSASLLIAVINFFQLPILAGMTPWFGVVGGFLFMAFPFYSNGIIRILFIGIYGCLFAPFLWWALTLNREVNIVREPLMAWSSPRAEPQSELMKHC